MKVETVEVDDRNKAMENFKSFLGELVNVPKSEVPSRRKSRPNGKPKANRKR